MFLDPSHRNKLVSIFGNLGAKGKISADSEQNSVCPSVSLKDRLPSYLQAEHPLYCVVLHDRITLRVDILPVQGQATGTAGFLIVQDPGYTCC